MLLENAVCGKGFSLKRLRSTLGGHLTLRSSKAGLHNVYLPLSTPHSQRLSLDDCFLEGLPTSHTHVPKEVSNSTGHASLSSLRSERAWVKSLLSLTESWCWGRGWLILRNEPQSCNRVLGPSFYIPGHLPIISRCLNTYRSQVLGIQVTCGLWATGLLFLDY